MPTYGYRCKACGHEFEEWQAFSADPLVTCPSCKKNALVRVIEGAGLIFKGSGFYLTDYRKDGAKSKEKEPTPAAEKKPEAPDPSNSGKVASKKATKPEKTGSQKSNG